MEDPQMEARTRARLEQAARAAIRSDMLDAFVDELTAGRTMTQLRRGKLLAGVSHSALQAAAAHSRHRDDDAGAIHPHDLRAAMTGDR